MDRQKECNFEAYFSYMLKREYLMYSMWYVFNL